MVLNCQRCTQKKAPSPRHHGLVQARVGPSSFTKKWATLRNDLTFLVSFGPNPIV